MVGCVTYLSVNAASSHDVGVGGAKPETQDVIRGLQEQLGGRGERGGRGGGMCQKSELPY